MNKENELRKLSQYLKENNGFESPFGHAKIDVSKTLGQGGNGIVYLGEIKDVTFAFKFLTNHSKRKIERFKAEYLNISVSKEKLVNIVNLINFGILKIDDVEFPYIIMKKYEKSLKKHREKLNDIKWVEICKLFKDLSSAICSLEKVGIIHRDLKPENILIDDDGKYILTDFGIAHFESDEFPIRDLTQHGERLANFEFSAPEQIGGGTISFATDIYCLAQIVYWFAFGHVNKGTGAMKFKDNFIKDDNIDVDCIIDKCLRINPDDRYQSINEIKSEIDSIKLSQKEINPFDDMSRLNQTIRSVTPEFYKKGGYTEDKDEINNLLVKINDAKFDRKLEYNTGSSNNPIETIKILENGNCLIDDYEVKIKKIWGLIGDSLYDDLLIIEAGKIEPYKINDEDIYSVAVINGDSIIPNEDTYAGFIRYHGKVVATNQVMIERRIIFPEITSPSRYMVIGAFCSCSVISENDSLIRDLQKVEKLDIEAIFELKYKITRKKSHNIVKYL